MLTQHLKASLKIGCQTALIFLPLNFYAQTATTPTAPPSAAVSPNTSATPTTTSAAPSTNCGNGVLDGDEQCDFGADNGNSLGCDRSCKIQSSWKCYPSTAPEYSELVTSGYQDSLKGLYWILANDMPVSPTATPGNTHISTVIAQAKCFPIVTGWERQCAQYNQDLRRFKELNVNNSIATAYGATTPKPICDNNSTLFDPQDGSDYKIKCSPGNGVF